MLYLDFETFYKSGKDGLSLRTKTYREYCQDPRFQTIGVALAWGEAEPVWYPGPEVAGVLAAIDWSTTTLVAHNSLFDASVLHFVYGHHPANIICTQSLAASTGLRLLKGGSLDDVSNALREAGYNIRHKGTEVLRADGMRFEDFSPQQLFGYGEYSKDDARICRDILKACLPLTSIEELRFQSTMLKCGTEPVFIADVPLLKQELIRIDELQRSTLDKAAAAKGCTPLQFKTILMSNQKFSALLEEYGAEVPMKVSKTTGKEAPALAKSDEGMQALLEHDDINIRVFAMARLGNKSSDAENKTQRMIDMAESGPLQLCYKIGAAHTGRLGSTQLLNVMALPSGRVPGTSNACRRALMAPGGYAVGAVDSSMVECVAHDSLVLTKQRGLIKIQHVSTLDEVWDGIEWVKHDGVILKGVKTVIEYGGLRATADHVVYTSSGRPVPLGTAKREALTLLVGERAGEAVQQLDTSPNTPSPANAEMGDSPLRMRPMRMGSSSRYKEWRVDKVHKVPQGAADEVSRYPAPGGEGVESEVRLSAWASRGKSLWQSHIRGYREPLRVLRAFCALCIRAVAHGYLQGARARPEGQQRALRSGKYSASHARGQCPEPSGELHGRVWGDIDLGVEVCAGLLPAGAPMQCESMDKSGADPGAVHCAGAVKVYDIVNAGPRHRFTCSGVVVSNCRVSAYAANDMVMNTIFNQGRDVYSDFAATLFGHPADVIRAGAKAGDPEMSKFRQWSKAGVLSGIFGTGGAGFLNYAKTVMKLKMAPAEATRVIEVFREMFVSTKDFWAVCDRVLRAMIRGQSGYFGGPDGKLFFYDGNADLFGTRCPSIRLPDGQYLRYLDLREQKAREALPGMFQRETEIVYHQVLGKNRVMTGIYGSKLHENLVQATAFAALKEQMNRINDKFRVIGNVHDEGIFLVPNGREEEAKAYALKCFATSPDWLGGCVLAGEVGVASRYGDT